MARAKRTRAKAKRSKRGARAVFRGDRVPAFPRDERPTAYGPMGETFNKIVRQTYAQEVSPRGKRPQFEFKYKRQTLFECDLMCARCQFRTRDGNRVRQCSRNNCRYLPFCWQHMQMLYKIKVARTELRDANGERYPFLGLFACATELPEGEILFQRGQAIIPYIGERLTQRETDARYDVDGVEHTGPYALSTPQRRDRVLDAACVRGSAAYANHRGDNPNAELQFVRGSALLQAARDIRNGEEILFSYGDEYRFDEPGVTSRTKYMSKNLARCNPRRQRDLALYRAVPSAEGYVFQKRERQG